MMASPNSPRPFRRIVVRFHDASSGRCGILSAARLARLFHAELVGLFVEDARLLELSNLPVMRQLSATSGTGARVNPEQLAQDFAAAAALARRALARIARQLGLVTTFMVLRGDATSVACEAVAPDDLVVVFEPTDPIARVVYPFSAIVRTVARSSGPILYAPHRLLERAGPVVAITQSPLDHAKHVAAAVATAMDERLIVLATAAASSLETGPAHTALPADIPHSTGMIGRFGPEAVDRVLAGTSESLIVINQALLTSNDPEFPAIAAQRRVPILIVGESADRD
jgi:hypothetical protein